MFTLIDLFEIAAKMEHNAENIYRNAIEKVDDKELESMLEWIAKEEISHKKWFENQKGSINLEVKEADLRQMVPGILEDMMGENTLTLNSVDFSKIKSKREMLEIFIDFENETIMFFELFEIFINDESTISGLKSIVDEEKEHIKQLTQIMESC